ncbi:MAG: 2-oxoacid:acceptor oxidoreductase family protein [Lachnospiraceae bacterium]|nr:2-oxoacid:acceptor oxidoreductase family protein [Lachnospiraceae bacterium]
MKRMILSGNDAAAFSAYALNEVSAVYPITPSTGMAEWTEKAINKRKLNIFGEVPKICTMQSEKGAAGMLHGLLRSGIVADTFTSSQGLLLMLPVMYKLRGEELPAVFHVAARSLAGNALSIYGDHSDVMAVRSAGEIMIASSGVQEAAFFAAVSHMLAVKCSLPVLHFFDGFDTSHEVRDVLVPEAEELKKYYPYKELEDFRNKAFRNESPRLYGISETQELYFQNQELINGKYLTVAAEFKRFCEVLAPLYGFAPDEKGAAEYYGDPVPEVVMISMGSVTETIQSVVDEERKCGRRCGCIDLHLYRPFPVRELLNFMPESVHTVVVLERTKEPGAAAEPLTEDVKSAFFGAGRKIRILSGRFGLGSKDTDKDDIRAAFRNGYAAEPKQIFTIGIKDDVTWLSLEKVPAEKITSEVDAEIKIYGMGADGAVSCARSSLEVFADVGHVQGRFFYDPRKSGNLTVSELRISKTPIRAAYRIKSPSLIAVYHPEFLHKCGIADEIRENGILLINQRPGEDLKFTADEKKLLIKKNIKIYILDACGIAERNHVKGYINCIMQTAVFTLSGLIGGNIAECMIKEILPKYDKGGTQTEEWYINNGKAIFEASVSCVSPELLTEAEWKPRESNYIDDFGREILEPLEAAKGDTIALSTLKKYGLEDGGSPTGLTKYEKRGLAGWIPEWNAEVCKQCNACVMQCPHQALRSFVKTEVGEEISSLSSKDYQGKRFTIQVSPYDCMACGNCADACPFGGIVMVQAGEELKSSENEKWKKLSEDYVYPKEIREAANIREAGYRKPMLEFSGACAGCGEPLYMRLLTSLFGDDLMIANATGCSSIWGGTFPHIPYTTDENGIGPAWGNSLFENNAEYGAGIAAAMDIWKERKGFRRKSVWIVGGDGWAGDIDNDGINYLITQNMDVNILILDNGSYANTGGQYSSLTPQGSSVKFRSGGNRVRRRNLALETLDRESAFTAEVNFCANAEQTLRAMKDADRYRGTSVIVAYCPCKLQGIKNMTFYRASKMVSEAGMWPIFSYFPGAEVKISSKAPDAVKIREYLMKEGRFDNNWCREHAEEIYHELRHEYDRLIRFNR